MSDLDLNKNWRQEVLFAIGVSGKTTAEIAMTPATSLRRRGAVKLAGIVAAAGTLLGTGIVLADKNPNTPDSNSVINCAVDAAKEDKNATYDPAKLTPGAFAAAYIVDCSVDANSADFQDSVVLAKSAQQELKGQ